MLWTRAIRTPSRSIIPAIFAPDMFVSVSCVPVIFVSVFVVPDVFVSVIVVPAIFVSAFCVPIIFVSDVVPRYFCL